jgi:HK97 family phage major capsid protein
VPGRLDDIRLRQTTIKSSLDALETQDETDETRLRADGLLEEWDELDAESKPLIERAEKIAAVRAAMAAETSDSGQTGEPGADDTQRARSESIRGMRGGQGPDLHVKRYVDPFAGMDEVRLGLTSDVEVRGRAMAAVEQYHSRSDQYQISDEAAAQCEALVKKGGRLFGTNVARQMLATGSSEYMAAFEQYLSDPGGYASRAALSLVSANGGYMVPFTLDPTIILTNAGSANPYRQIATIKTTTTNDWNGVTSAGVSAAWTAEGIEASDNTPTVGQLKITPQKATAYLFGSFEVLGDSEFASQLPMLLADAKDRIEETAFAIGAGGTQPNGVIPRGTSAAMTSGTAVTGMTAADAYTIQGLLPARWRGPEARNVWLMNLNLINKLRNVPKFTGSTESIVDDSGDQPRMLGKPIYESTSILGTFATTSKVVAYLDARQFYIVDRVGMSVVYDPIVLGATNRIPTGQGAWYAFWRTGSDVSVATAVRVGSTLT